MILFDVNILIYAHRSDEKYHDFYREYVESIVNGHELFGMSILVSVAFIRIITHPHFPGGATPLPQALAVVDSLAAAPNANFVSPGRRHWEIVADLCRSTGATGKHVADAQHAAVAIENACTWVTRDEDFTAYRNRGLKLVILRPEFSNRP